MFGVFKNAWSEVDEALALIPDGILSLLILAAAVAVALVIRRLADVLLRKTLATKHPFLYSLFLEMEGPLRLAVVLLALNIAVAVAPLGNQLAAVLSRILQVCFIALIGWIAMTALDIAAAIYLRRFRLDVEDNLLARKQVTQVRVLKAALNTLIVTVTIAAAMMTFEQVRQYGVSLFASAGIAGIVVGFAARPMLSNLIAGVQLAITQPIRIEDAVVVENEMGFIEEITSTYVVVRLWDWRRLIVPLTYFIEKPFQNWTRETSAQIGTVFIRTDYTVPTDRLRTELDKIVKASSLWDGRVANLQMWEADERGVQLRALVSARNAGAASDLRCEVREKLIDFLQREYPHALPHTRQEMVADGTPSLVPQTETRAQVSR